MLGLVSVVNFVLVVFIFYIGFDKIVCFLGMIKNKLRNRIIWYEWNFFLIMLVRVDVVMKFDVMDLFFNIKYERENSVRVEMWIGYVYRVWIGFKIKYCEWLIGLV